MWIALLEFRRLLKTHLFCWGPPRLVTVVFIACYYKSAFTLHYSCALTQILFLSTSCVGKTQCMGVVWLTSIYTGSHDVSVHDVRSIVFFSAAWVGHTHTHTHTRTHRPPGRPWSPGNVTLYTCTTNVRQICVSAAGNSAAALGWT